MSFFGVSLPSVLRRSADYLIDQDITLFFAVNQEWRNGFFNHLMVMFSYSFTLWIIVGLLLAWHIYRKAGGNQRRIVLLAVLLACSVGTADLSSNAIKELVHRPRPNNEFPYVHHYKNNRWQQSTPESAADPRRLRTSSFYSAHAANSAAVAAFLTGAIPGLSPLLYAIPLSVCYSRVYSGRHYPGDVLFGWLAGLLIGKVYARGYRRILSRKEDFFAPSSLRFPR